MTQALHIGEWILILSENREYINMTELAKLNGLFFFKWYSEFKTKFILDHLHELNMSPIYTYEGDFYVRIELLDTILHSRFMSFLTPEVPDDLTRYVVDYMLSNAQKRMGEVFYYISIKDHPTIANQKVDSACKLYHNSERRRMYIILESGKHTRSNGISYPRDAIEIETQINANHVRMLLAMLVIHSSRYH